MNIALDLISGGLVPGWMVDRMPIIPETNNSRMLHAAALQYQFYPTPFWSCVHSLGIKYKHTPQPPLTRCSPGCVVVNAYIIFSLSAFRLALASMKSFVVYLLSILGASVPSTYASANDSPIMLRAASEHDYLRKRSDGVGFCHSAELPYISGL
jgi:hypothetical protein